LNLFHYIKELLVPPKKMVPLELLPLDKSRPDKHDLVEFDGNTYKISAVLTYDYGPFHCNEYELKSSKGKTFYLEEQVSDQKAWAFIEKTSMSFLTNGLQIKRLLEKGLHPKRLLHHDELYLLESTNSGSYNQSEHIPFQSFTYWSYINTKGTCSIILQKWCDGSMVFIKGINLQESDLKFFLRH